MTFKNFLEGRTAANVAAESETGAGARLGVAAVDGERAKIKAQMQAAASEQADIQMSIDGLMEEMRAAIEDGRDTTEIEGRIVAERVGQERLALRHSMLERVAREKDAALLKKQHRDRVAKLERELAAALAVISIVDEETIPVAITLSEKLSRRAQAEHDAFTLGARLMHVTGIPRGLGNLGWDETRLVASFLARHPEALRPVPFGERPWRPVTIAVPALTPDRRVAALEQDDAAASK